MHTVGGAKRSL